ncbi:MAG: hypothetical protein KF814_15985 [Nitrospiraceae bacterium]|nr:hypothetical protein [Nitrospiraceae bacterium]
MNKYSSVMLGVALGTLFGAAVGLAGPIDPTHHPHPEHMQKVHEAEHVVDHAWEVYHRAALGGTIASPALQAEIEHHLHEARTLVTQAQQAAERGDQQQVDRLVGQVHSHTAQAIDGSKEQKK